MDILPVSAMSQERRETQYRAHVAQENAERQRRHAEVLKANAQEIGDNRYAPQVANHERIFPFIDNLTTLMFIMICDLSETQKGDLQVPFLSRE